MSKLIDSLNRVQVTMTEAPATEPHVDIPVQHIQPREPQTPVKTPASHETNRHQDKFELNKTTFYSVFAAVMVIVVLALILSYKAFSLISQRNVELTTLVQVVNKQNDKIKSLQSSIQELNDQQSRQFAQLQESFAAVDKLINNNAKELAEMSMRHDALDTSVQALKSENRESKGNYSKLNGEIVRVKQMLARMMGEATSTPE